MITARGGRERGEAERARRKRGTSAPPDRAATATAAHAPGMGKSRAAAPSRNSPGAALTLDRDGGTGHGGTRPGGAGEGPDQRAGRWAEDTPDLRTFGPSESLVFHARARSALPPTCSTIRHRKAHTGHAPGPLCGDGGGTPSARLRRLSGRQLAMCAWAYSSQSRPGRPSAHPIVHPPPGSARRPNSGPTSWRRRRHAIHKVATPASGRQLACDFSNQKHVLQYVQHVLTFMTHKSRRPFGCERWKNRKKARMS